MDRVELDRRDVLDAVEVGAGRAVGNVILVRQMPIDDGDLILAVGSLNVLKRRTGARAGASPRSAEHLSEHHPLSRSGQRCRE
jgi:hypothetical protein